MNAFRELLSGREGGSTSVTMRSRSSLPLGRPWPATYAPGHEFRASPPLEALKGSLDPAWTQLEQVLREPVVSGQTNESLQPLSLHFPGLSWPLPPLPWEMRLRASPMGAQLSHPTQEPGPGPQPSTPRPSENSSGALCLRGLSLPPERELWRAGVVVDPPVGPWHPKEGKALREYPWKNPENLFPHLCTGTLKQHDLSGHSQGLRPTNDCWELEGPAPGPQEMPKIWGKQTYVQWREPQPGPLGTKVPCPCPPSSRNPGHFPDTGMPPPAYRTRRRQLYRQLYPQLNTPHPPPTTQHLDFSPPDSSRCKLPEWW